MEANIRFCALLRSSLTLVTALAAIGYGLRDAAGQEAPRTSAEPLMSEVLDELGGRQLALVKLVVPPGVSTTPHRHRAYLAVYVVSGHIESAVDDHEPTLYGPGDVWYEGHMQLHSTFRNPSSTEPFVAILFWLRDAEPPANASGSGGDGH